MTAYDPRVAQRPLTDFQRATVRHVATRLYQDDVRRFLVADETGLGKSMVARGVIAEAIAALQDDDRVQRIDVVYVCSNLDIARQNTSRLLAGEGNVQSITSRLTLLARHSRELNKATTATGKPVNLVAFTPGTSFEHGSQTGRVDERALLFLLLEARHNLSGWARRAAMTLLQGGVTKLETFERHIREMNRELGGEPDPVIAKDFGERCVGALDDQFHRLIDDIGRRAGPPDVRPAEWAVLIGELRNALAKASIATLEPDLVILDEFQRFRHLLSDQDDSNAELARELFDYEQARVLLLSATPYKPYTVADEAIDGENHHRDFFELLRFLKPDERWLSEVRRHFDRYRDSLLTRKSAVDAAHSLRTLLLEVMCRTERPPLGQDGNDMVRELVTESTASAGDIVGYATLRTLARELNGSAPIDYWKSVPYFVNFMEGYQLGDRLREAWKDEATRERLLPVVRSTQRLRRPDIQSFQELDTGNGRLRALMDTTVRSDQARMLWLPPSLPYHTLGQPFAGGEKFTKRLVFSSWNATPTAIASLLSYEADRQLMADGHAAENTPEARHRLAGRLSYRMDGSRPGAMTTLALFWPNPGLAAITDPLAFARLEPHTQLSIEAVAGMATNRVTVDLPRSLIDANHSGESTVVDAYLPAVAGRVARRDIAGGDRAGHGHPVDRRRIWWTRRTRGCGAGPAQGQRLGRPPIRRTGHRPRRTGRVCARERRLASPGPAGGRQPEGDAAGPLAGGRTTGRRVAHAVSAKSEHRTVGQPVSRRTVLAQGAPVLRRRRSPVHDGRVRAAPLRARGWLCLRRRVPEEGDRDRPDSTDLAGADVPGIRPGSSVRPTHRVQQPVRAALQQPGDRDRQRSPDRRP